jgi:hypothetical protein
MTAACLLLKAPRPGLVKTRLAATLGDDRATALYRALVERQIRAVPADWTLRVAYAPAEAAEEMAAWLNPVAGRPIVWSPQPSGDLGARLAAAVREAFAAGAQRVLLLGGDCPTLDTTHLREAEDRLASHGVTIAPARDGGYVLLGLAREAPGLFDGIAWSTPSVLAETLARADRLGLAVGLLPAHEDVDDQESYDRLRPSLPPEAGRDFSS